MLKNPQHGIVEDCSGAIGIGRVAVTNVDHRRVTYPVQLSLALGIIPFTSVQQYVEVAVQ